jgi:hypothetical protein
MKRGTLVLASGRDTHSFVSPTFSKGGTAEVSILRLLAKWIQREATELDATRLIEQRFVQYHGDSLTVNRGEVFVAAE